jgi:hypothetical protein
MNSSVADHTPLFGVAAAAAATFVQTLQRMGGALPPQMIQQLGGMGGLQQLMKAMDGMDKGGRMR